MDRRMGKLLDASAAARVFARAEFSLFDAPGNIALRSLWIRSDDPTARGLTAHEHGYRLELLGETLRAITEHWWLLL